MAEDRRPGAERMSRDRVPNLATYSLATTLVKGIDIAATNDMSRTLQRNVGRRVTRPAPDRAQSPRARMMFSACG
jgi:hypothetical protein